MSWVQFLHNMNCFVSTIVRSVCYLSCSMNIVHDVQLITEKKYHVNLISALYQSISELKKNILTKRNVKRISTHFKLFIQRPSTYLYYIIIYYSCYIIIPVACQFCHMSFCSFATVQIVKKRYNRIHLNFLYTSFQNLVTTKVG